jgi:hypothetical protein
MKREKAIEAVKEFPMEFNLEELIERLIFIDRVEKGIEQADQGLTKSAQEVKEIVKKW